MPFAKYPGTNSASGQSLITFQKVKWANSLSLILLLRNAPRHSHFLLVQCVQSLRNCALSTPSMGFEYSRHLPGLRFMVYTAKTIPKGRFDGQGQKNVIFPERKKSREENQDHVIVGELAVRICLRFFYSICHHNISKSWTTSLNL